MKILLVVPKYNFTNNIDFDYFFPLGLAYISAVIKKAKYELDILNLNHYGGTIEELMNKKLNSKKYDVVCTGHMGIGYRVVEKIIISARKHKSNPKIILGGALITSEPKIVFEALKPDFGVISEGEVTILELLEYIQGEKDLKNLRGIIYKNKNNQTIITEPRPQIQDLDSLPYPDFDGLEFNKLLDNQSFNGSPFLLDHPRYYPILCSRGCAFHCTFCYHCLGPKYIMRSIDSVIEELRAGIKRYRINSIIIMDDLFSANRERLNDFCKKIKELKKEFPWEIRWMCQLSVHHIDREMLETLKDAGCLVISFGFESYSPIVLKSMKKPITPEQIDRAIKLVWEFGLIFQGNFIFGDCAETKETAKTTLDYWKKNCNGQVKLLFVQPYPGSELYEHCLRKGIIKDRLDFISNHMRHQNWYNMTDSMTDEEVMELKKEILNSRRDYVKYAIPIKKKWDPKNKKRGEFLVKCPFCKKNIHYKNMSVENNSLYSMHTNCRNCYMYFYIVSPLYKLGVDYYYQLDFFRKNYLLIKDKVLSSKV